MEQQPPHHYKRGAALSGDQVPAVMPAQLWDWHTVGKTVGCSTGSDTGVSQTPRSKGLMAEQWEAVDLDVHGKICSEMGLGAFLQHHLLLLI